MGVRTFPCERGGPVGTGLRGGSAEWKTTMPRETAAAIRMTPRAPGLREARLGWLDHG